MAKTVYLIRHGATEGDGKVRYKGTIDVPLSHQGEEQARRAALFIRDSLSGQCLEAVYTSDLSRALGSAEIIAEGLGPPDSLEPIIVPGLRERHFGRWEGMSLEEIAQRYPEEFGNWARDPLRFSPVGGESTFEVRDRAVSALEEILSRHEEGAIAVVAHGGINRVVLCHVLGIPLENIFLIEQDHACVNIIEFGEGHRLVRLLNGVSPGR